MSNRLYKCAVFLARGIMYPLYGVKRPDNSSVPNDGGIIVAANHTSLLDAVFIAIAVKRKLTFMAKKELFGFKPFGKLISALGAFPVDRGNNDIAAVKTAVKLLRGGHAMLLFPQGTRCKRADNVSAKHGAVRLAILTGAPILPVYVSEGHRIFGKRGYVKIGSPIDYSAYKKAHPEEEDYERLSQELMEKIYSLSEEKSDD